MSNTLSKSLSPVQLWGIIVGMVISGMYFGWNYALQYTSPLGLFGATLIVTAFYLTFMFCFAEMSTAIPHAGGPMAYSKRVMGPFGGFVAGFSVLVEYMLATPAISLSIGAYIHFLMPSIPVVAAAAVSYIIFVLINCLGVKTAAIVELIVTVVAIGGIILFGIGGIGHVNINNIIGGDIFFGGWKGIFAAIPFAIWFYLAVEGGAMAAEECKNPKKDIPKGFLLGIFTLVILAAVTLLITTGAGETSKINNMDSPLPGVLAIIFGEGNILSKILSFIGLFGLVASLHGIIIGYSRQTFAMAREGYLPKFLSYTTEKSKTPIWAIIVPSIIGIAFVFTGATATIITISCFGAIALYIISMITVFMLRIKEPNLNRPFKVAYPIVPVIALTIAVVFLIAVTYANLATMLWVALTYLVAIVFYLTYSRMGLKKQKAAGSAEVQSAAEVEGA
jgi:ethanolamine permease